LRSAAQRGDFAHERISFGAGVAITENNVGAVGSEAQGDAATDATGGAGDERHASI
jgi:hypothetical protein